MKTFILFPGVVFMFMILMMGAPYTSAQNNSVQAVNDTIDVYPFVPTVYNILTNDFIPSPDSILRVTGGGSQNVRCVNDLNSKFTFEGRRWGYGGVDSSSYTILMKSGETASARILFRIHDHSNDYLDINNVKALFFAYGNHFFRENAEFEVPKGSGKTSIFSNSFWIGGTDGQKKLRFAGERYRQGTSFIAGLQPDFYAGPVMDSVNYSIYQDTVWNYIWKLNKSDIDYHRAHFYEPGYQPIHNILTWPGNGNTSLGQARRLAPFSDRNGDGIYNPYDGDYPEIRGDQALFFIFNDDRGSHLESTGAKLRIEIHGMAYAFDMPEDSALKNTVFLHYKIYNRSQNTYDSTYMGIFTDIDLGYASDDYIGCDVERNMYYGYNGIPVDGSGQSYAYGANPPVQAVTLLAGPYMDDDGIDNPRFNNNGQQLCDYSVNGINFGDEIADNERFGMTGFVYINNSNSGVPAYMTDPLYASEYYQLMKGFWKDGTHMIYGGNGNASTGGYGPECRFMFPGESDTLNWGVGCQPPSGPVNWTESTAKNNPSDRRGLGITGPVTFKPGDVQEIDIMFNWARDYNSGGTSGSIYKLNEVVDEVTRMFITNRLPDGSPFYGLSEQTPGNASDVALYPNPARDRITIAFKNQLPPHSITADIMTPVGQLLNTTVLTETGNGFYFETSGLPSGFYLVRITAGHDVFVKKVLIVR